jgi:hypothetical protein
VGDKAAFSVAPKMGLPINAYAATVTVSGGNGISAAFPVSFSVTAAGSIVITNAPAALFTGESWTFQATLSGIGGEIIWSAAGGGNIGPATGEYSAPNGAAVAAITAESALEPSIKASASVRITPAAMANFDGNEPLSPSLLGLANAYGSIAPADLAKYDLNGDGKIDDEDIVMLFRLMAW